MFELNALMLFALILAAWNIFIFVLYGADKHKAKKKKWRISETTLVLCAFLMGGVGAFFGMTIFRHKTKHLKFRLLLPVALIVNIGTAALILHNLEIINFLGR